MVRTCLISLLILLVFTFFIFAYTNTNHNGTIAYNIFNSSELRKHWSFGYYLYTYKADIKERKMDVVEGMKIYNDVYKDGSKLRIDVNSDDIIAKMVLE